MGIMAKKKAKVLPVENQVDIDMMMARKEAIANEIRDLETQRSDLGNLLIAKREELSGIKTRCKAPTDTLIKRLLANSTVTPIHWLDPEEYNDGDGDKNCIRFSIDIDDNIFSEIEESQEDEDEPEEVEELVSKFIGVDFGYQFDDGMSTDWLNPVEDEAEFNKVIKVLKDNFVSINTARLSSSVNELREAAATAENIIVRLA